MQRKRETGPNLEKTCCNRDAVACYRSWRRLRLADLTQERGLQSSNKHGEEDEEGDELEEIDTLKNLEPLGGKVGRGQGRREACAGRPEKKHACAWGR